jgi:Zn-dependent alcohol dehydrogenase
MYRFMKQYWVKCMSSLTFKVGDVVIPCYTPECKEADCIFCQSQRTNLCPKIRLMSMQVTYTGMYPGPPRARV